MSTAKEHLAILRQGAPAWNDFMHDHSYDLRANFIGANLSGMDLTGAIMNRGMFEGADLRGANLSGGTFQEANFNRALLTGIRAERAGFGDSLFREANLDHAHLVRARFGGANLGGADFSNSLMATAT